MLALTIENAEVEQLLKDVFAGQAIDKNPAFLLFLRQQKLLKDLSESLEQINQGQVMPIDTAFDSVLQQVLA